MKTKNLLTAICGSAVLAAAAAGPGAPQLDEADYEDFALSGVFDPELSTAEAHDMVSRGVFSGNPRLVRLTLEAMGGHALSDRFGEATVERNFGAVPQLKEFLIGRWRDALYETGGTFQPRGLDDGLEVAADLLQEAFEAGGIHRMWAVTASFNPDLSLIPIVLASSFPGDEDVHRLLWEFHPLLHESPDADRMILSLFNDGLFKTPEVDRLRIDSLKSDDSSTFNEAAKGLAMSRPEGGLEALVSALQGTGKYDSIREMHLADAIGSYGPEAIPLLSDEDIERVRQASLIHLPWLGEEDAGGNRPQESADTPDSVPPR